MLDRRRRRHEKRALASNKRPQKFPSKEEIAKFLREHPGDASRRDLARAFNVTGDDRARLRAMLKEMESEGGVTRAAPKKFRIAGELPDVIAIDIMSVDEEGDLVCLPASWEGETEPPMIKHRASRSAETEAAAGRRRPRARPVEARRRRRVRRENPEAARARRAPLSCGLQKDEIRRRRRAGRAPGAQHLHDRPREDARCKRGRPRLGRSKSAADRRAGPRARVREIAGHVDDQHAFTLIALAAHDVPVEFPADVIAEAERRKAAGT